LVGFSRNGYYVEYAVSHSDTPYAAAVADDNWDPSYVTETLVGGDFMAAKENGAEPYGAGLQQWLENAPGFNADRIHAPLLMQVQSNGIAGILGMWELFSRLRHLQRPVELYASPDLLHAIHNTQNPGQIAGIQQRVVDWFEFWLRGSEDPDPEKSAQYRRWEELCDMHKAASPDRPSFCVVTKRG
jgi:hypothetical protein